MIHPASHFSMHNLTRGKTASSVARAAYIGRRRLRDDRIGRTCSYTRKAGLLEEGLTNWPGRVEDLWNAVEARETRCNSRVAREFRAALPVELPLAEQRRMVHGFTCYLKDRFGMAVYWAIHAPHCHDPEIGKRLEAQLEDGSISPAAYLEALSDPTMTNLNYHVHMLAPTRRREPGGGFGEKVHELDRMKVGSETLKSIRAEWQRRVNAALERVGASARIDLRSYAEIAEAGEAPRGLMGGQHRGPAATAISRRKAEKVISRRASDSSAIEPPGAVSGAHREERSSDLTAQEPKSATKSANDDLWETWFQMRALERECARLASRGQEIAAKREKARREDARRERERLVRAETEEETARAAGDAFHLVAPRGDMNWSKIVAAAARGEPSQNSDDDEPEIDPETYDMPEASQPAGMDLVVRRAMRGRIRNG